MVLRLGVSAVAAVDVVGRREVMDRVDSLPLSIDWLPGDRLVVVDSTRHRLLRQAPGGTLVTHADRPRCRGPGGQALRAHDRR